VLSRKYHVDNILTAIFDFDPAKDKIGIKPAVPKAEKSTPRKKISRNHQPVTESEPEESEATSTPSPIMAASDATYSRGIISPSVLRLKPRVTLSHLSRQKEILKSIWNGEDYCVILNLLRFSPYQFDIHFILDHQGNTPLHWAAALGKPDIIKQLLKHGANIHMSNAWGESALVNAVLRSENYAQQTFPLLLKLLKNIVLSVDALGQTLMHHIVLGCVKGSEAAYFYFESLSAWIIRKGDRVAGFLDVGDEENGDTALHHATRFKIHRVVEVLINLGASYMIKNRKGITSFDISSGDARLSSLFRSLSQGAGNDEAEKERFQDIDEFEWHGRRSWSESKSLPVTRLQIYLEQHKEELLVEEVLDSTTNLVKTSPISSSVLGKRGREE